MYACMYVYIYMYMHLSLSLYIYIYTYTHIYDMTRQRSRGAPMGTFDQIDANGDGVISREELCYNICYCII